MKLHLWIGIVVLAMSGYGLDWSYTLNIKTNPWEATLGYGKYAAISTLTEGDITVPRSVDGYPVVALNTNAFANCSKLKNIIIQNNVKKIGPCCFTGCDRLETIVIPNTITTIPWAAFEHCTNLQSVTLPTSVTSIENRAFEDCYNLSHIDMPNVRNIDFWAFGGCKSLASITFPSTLSFIDGTAFINCTNLTRISVSDLARFCQITSTGRERLNESTVYTSPGLYMDNIQLTDIIIPSGTKSIGDWSVFSWCSGIRSVVIPDSVTYVGKNAFYSPVEKVDQFAYQSSSELESVIIGNGVKEIGDYAFYGCTKLTNVVMGTGVTKIGSNCFQHGHFKNFTFGDNVEIVRENAFDGCGELETLIFPSTITNIGSMIVSACFKLSAIYLPTNYEGNVSRSFGSFASKIIRYVPEQTLVFDLCGGNMEQTAKIVKFNSAYGSLPEPVRDGYVFDGWFYNGERITAQSLVRALDDHELTAAWKPIKYAVAFDANGGTGEMGGIEVEYDSVTNLPLNVFRYPKMVFDGWATNATGEAVYADGASISNVCTEAGGVQTLFAVWSPRVVASPVMTPGDGFVFRTDSCPVTLSCATEGATIYYSTNGTTPRTSASNAYNGPFAVSGAVMVIAVAVYDGVKSAYMTASLVKGAPLVPMIAPSDGHLFVGDSCEVTITCPTETATIYYTVDGSTPQRSETCRYTGPFSINKTTTIKAFAANDTFDSERVTATITKWTLTLAEAVGAPALVFSTDGDAEWTPIADATATSGYSAKSGAIGDAESGAESVTWLETSVSGSGSFSFQWKVSCEHDDFGDCTWDRLSAFTNGVEVARIDGESGWCSMNLRFDDVGAHTIRWAFIKDDFNEEQFPDIAWVSGVVWTPDSGIDIDPIPEISSDSEIASALAGSADEMRLKTIITNKAEYDAYRGWVEAHSLNHQTVKNSSHTWASYVLGTSVLLENEPTVEFSEAYMSNDSDGGSVVVNGRMMVEVVVKDGARAVNVDATKVASMFEATSDLVDWTDAAKVELSVTPVNGTGEGVHFLVAPVDVSAERVFMRIKK